MSDPREPVTVEVGGFYVRDGEACYAASLDDADDFRMVKPSGGMFYIYRREKLRPLTTAVDPALARRCPPDAVRKHNESVREAFGLGVWERRDGGCMVVSHDTGEDDGDCPLEGPACDPTGEWSKESVGRDGMWQQTPVSQDLVRRWPRSKPLPKGCPKLPDGPEFAGYVIEGETPEPVTFGVGEWVCEDGVRARGRVINRFGVLEGYRYDRLDVTRYWTLTGRSNDGPQEHRLVGPWVEPVAPTPEPVTQAEAFEAVAQGDDLMADVRAKVARAGEERLSKHLAPTPEPTDAGGRCGELPVWIVVVGDRVKERVRCRHAIVGAKSVECFIYPDDTEECVAEFTRREGEDVVAIREDAIPTEAAR